MRLIIKCFGSEYVKKGQIIVRQRGTQFQIGKNVGLGKDFTIFAKESGTVLFSYLTKHKQAINVIPN